MENAGPAIQEIISPLKTRGEVFKILLKTDAPPARPPVIPGSGLSEQLGGAPAGVTAKFQEHFS